MTGVRRLLLKALLLAVLFGLAVMHTFGHGAHGTHRHPDAHDATAAVAVMTVAVLADADCHGCGEHQPWQVFTVCVAVLSALVVLVLGLWLLRRNSGGLHPPVQAATGLPASRGPPAVDPLRIRLARLSVSRT